MSAPSEASLIAYVNQAIQAAKEKAAGGPSASMQLLIADLTPFLPGNDFVGPMIQRAKQNLYDDMLSHLACPSLTLIRQCENAGLREIGRNAINGKYDS
jgi:hypothetical protein